jgi:hypothetical protein
MEHKKGGYRDLSSATVKQSKERKMVAVSPALAATWDGREVRQPERRASQGCFLKIVYTLFTKRICWYRRELIEMSKCLEKGGARRGI